MCTICMLKNAVRDNIYPDSGQMLSLARLLSHLCGRDRVVIYAPRGLFVPSPTMGPIYVHGPNLCLDGQCLSMQKFSEVTCLVTYTV